MTLGLLVYQRAYADKIYPNVYVEENKIAGLQKQQAFYLLSKYYDQIREKEIILVTPKKEIAIKLSDTGISYDINRIIDEAYQVGRAQSGPKELLTSSQTLWRKTIIPVKPKIDQETFSAFKNLTFPQLDIAAKDAILEIKDGQVVVIQEEIGQKANSDNLIPKILEAFNDPSINSINLEVEELKPVTTTGGASQAKEFTEQILAKKIELVYEQFSFLPSVEDLAGWISFNNDNGTIKASLDDIKIKTYLNTVSNSFEVQKVNKKVNAASGQVIVEGKPGKYLDKDEAIRQIKSEISQKDNFTIALKTYTKEPDIEKIVPTEGLTPGKYPGKYIDVDLTQQRMCLLEGNDLRECYVISSGKSSTPTPVGTRQILNKSERQWSSKYGLWMPWWQSLGGDYGIHELPEWPNGYKEGEAHLGTPVSHGCIRLGVGPAQTLYNWTDIGTQVYIHK